MKSSLKNPPEGLRLSPDELRELEKAISTRLKISKAKELYNGLLAEGIPTGLEESIGWHRRLNKAKSDGFI